MACLSYRVTWWASWCVNWWVNSTHLDDGRRREVHNTSRLRPSSKCVLFTLQYHLSYDWGQKSHLCAVYAKWGWTTLTCAFRHYIRFKYTSWYYLYSFSLLDYLVRKFLGENDSLQHDDTNLSALSDWTHFSHYLVACRDRCSYFFSVNSSTKAVPH